MPASAAPDITVAEAEKRLGIEPPPRELTRRERDAEAERIRAAKEKEVRAEFASRDQARLEARYQASLQESSQPAHISSHTTSHTAVLQDSLPASLRNKKSKELTVSKTFRLPLGLANELELIASRHDIPMVTILAEALELHLARFPR